MTFKCTLEGCDLVRNATEGELTPTTEHVTEGLGPYLHILRCFRVLPEAIPELHHDRRDDTLNRWKCHPLSLQRQCRLSGVKQEIVTWPLWRVPHYLRAVGDALAPAMFSETSSQFENCDVIATILIYGARSSAQSPFSK